MSEYGDLKTHMPVWSINVTLLKSMCYVQSPVKKFTVPSSLLNKPLLAWHIWTCFATVANATVAKHTDVHIPARRKSRPLPLRGSSVPEHSVTMTLDRAGVWKWTTTDVMIPEVPWHYALWFFSLGLCQRPGIRPTWPHWPKGTDHCSREEYRCTHADACVARTWLSYRCVPCHPWFTHRTSLVAPPPKKKTNPVFPWLWAIPLRQVLWFSCYKCL